MRSPAPRAPPLAQVAKTPTPQWYTRTHRNAARRARSTLYAVSPKASHSYQYSQSIHLEHDQQDDAAARNASNTAAQRNSTTRHHDSDTQRSNTLHNKHPLLQALAAKQEHDEKVLIDDCEIAWFPKILARPEGQAKLGHAIDRNQQKPGLRRIFTGPGMLPALR